MEIVTFWYNLFGSHLAINVALFNNMQNSDRIHDFDNVERILTELGLLTAFIRVNILMSFGDCILDNILIPTRRFDRF